MTDTFVNFVEDTRKETEDALKDHVINLDEMKNRQVNHMLEIQAKSLNNLRKLLSDMIVELKEQVDSRRAKLDRLERSIYHALEELERYQKPTSGGGK
ncbi:hypothetical protein BV898_12685 [Hypsibius exemplaris]|uniref:Uncharacterized protein n=1 Tax=Hypsibius exemplaris TaxID=2072580 RepID=A0A1W0WCZ0_HYPEX|nr:hypothetical protein BV898_12685 [Hypsibius exemplaris]